MIPFFRKIRKKLADDNNTLKYLRYAVGEIMLVVIGILIALQINDWNETRKNRAKELSYLMRMKEEFEDNLKVTETNLDVSTTFKELTETALKVYSGDTIVDAGHLAVAIEWASFGAPAIVKDNVWQDLVSSGNSDLVSNSLLRLAISEYYNINKMHWEFYRNAWVDDHNSTHDLTSAVLSWKDRNSIANSFTHYILKSEVVFPEISTDFATLRKKLIDSPNFESKLYTMYNLHKLRESFDNSEISAIRHILSALNDEIERH